MGVFILYIVFVFLFSLVFYRFNKNRSDRGFTELDVIKLKKTKKKIYVTLCGLMLFLIGGLRHYTVGTDTPDYVDVFRTWIYRPLSSLDFSGSRNEFAYAALNKFVSLFTTNYTWFLLVVSLIFAVSICVLIYRYSKEPVISFICVLTLGLFYFSMAGLRQIIAMSICFFAYKYIRERKPIKFLILLTIAYFFHNTAIIFLMAYPLARMKIGLKQIIALLIVFLIGIFYKSQIMHFIFEVLKWERIETYQNREITLSLSGFFIQLAVLVFCLYYYRDTVEKDKDDLSLYNMVFIGAMFQSLTVVIAEFFRISMYFSSFNIILIANAIMSEKNIKIRALVYFIVCVLLLAYYFVFSYDSGGIYPYKFFWEQVYFRIEG